MSLKCSGMQNILNGFLRYRSRLRGQLLKQFEMVSDNPHPQSIIVTCVDSRIVASRITQSNPGETFVSRNPGSLIPNYNVLNPKTPRPEEAALELACLYNNIDTVVVCGHADCKAMNLVYENRKSVNQPSKDDSVLKSWLMSNSAPTVQKYTELENNEFKKALTFTIGGNQSFQAFIDPENEFAYHDKFSMVNALTQLENLKHYKFLREPLEKKKINAYAMWLDIYCGEVYVFSYKDKQFVKLNDSTYDRLLTSININ